MSMKDRILAKQGLLKPVEPVGVKIEQVLPAPAEPPAKPEAKKPAKAAKPPKPKATETTKETVTFGCGCIVHVNHLKNSFCLQCQRAKRAEKIERKSKAHEADKGRLPDLSAVVAVYNSATQTWTGSLTITLPGEPIAYQRFEATGGSQTRLLRALDGLYREWVEKNSLDGGEKVS